MDAEDGLEILPINNIRKSEKHGKEYLEMIQKPGPGVAIRRQIPSEKTSQPRSIPPKQKPMAMAPFGAAKPKTGLNIAIALSRNATATRAPKVIQRAAAGAAIVRERPKLQAACAAETKKYLFRYWIAT
jgi:hypothetical protein